MKDNLCEIVLMVVVSLIEFIYGYLNLGKVVCIENPTIVLVEIPLWIIIKAMVQMNLSCFIIIMAYMYRYTSCHLRWIPYLWLVAFFYAVWTIVGFYLFFAQCFSREHVADSLFVVFSLVVGAIFSNLNFRYIYYIGNGDFDEEIDNDDRSRSLLRSVIYEDEDYL